MISIPRGTHDLFGTKIKKTNSIRSILEKTAQSFGYEEIKTPIFEHAETFTYNDESNVSANKELFYLKHEKYILRPENTASVVRATLTNKLLESNNNENIKFFYFGSMFRYERPQSGRYREFMQFGIENINSKHILSDIETISMVESLLSTLNLHLKLRVNYLGNQSQKNEWNKSLTKYFSQHKDLLSEASHSKIDTNPLRILDDKEDSQTECVKQAPKIVNFLNQEKLDEIKLIKNYLEDLNISYVWDENLVRGIDYYTGLVYEWEYNGQAVISGGRYDELFTKFDPKKSIPCLGFAIGIERLIETLDHENYSWNIVEEQSIYLIDLNNHLVGCEDMHISKQIFDLCKLLRKHGFVVFTNWDKTKLKDHFKYSSKKNSDYLLIFGPEEKSKNEIIFKSQKNTLDIKNIKETKNTEETKNTTETNDLQEQDSNKEQTNKIQVKLSLDNLEDLVQKLKQLTTQ